MVVDERRGRALILSIIVTLIALLVFGYVKGRFTGTRPARSALQTTLIGGHCRSRRVPDRAGFLLTAGGPAAQFPSKLPSKPGGLVPGTTTRSPGMTW